MYARMCEFKCKSTANQLFVKVFITRDCHFDCDRRSSFRLSCYHVIRWASEIMKEKQSSNL